MPRIDSELRIATEITLSQMLHPIGRLIVAKILAYQTPAMGHLSPTSVLLTELRNRGHDITLRTLAAGVEIGHDMGFATEAVDPRIEAIPLDDWKATNPKAALQRALDVFARRAEYEVD